ncbi:MAG: H-NS histone family protein [Pseudomonadota bacterium]
MSMIDLSSMSKPDLQKLHKDVGKAIESFDDRVKQDALATLEQKARELGFSLSELTGGKRAKTVNPPKYRNPDSPEQTWTGRGRQPQWIKDALAEGKDLGLFEI